MLLLLTGLAAAADQKTTEADLQKVRGQIEDLQKSIRADTNARDELAGRLREAETTVAGARRSLSELQAERADSNRRRDELRAERGRVENTLADERAALAGQIRAAYTIGRDEHLKLLLNQQDPAQLGRMFAYYGYFGRARAEKIAEIRSQLTRIVALDQALAAEAERLADLERQARTHLDELKEARAERSAVLKQTDQQIKTRTASLNRLKREEATLEKLLADLRRVMADFPLTSDEPFESARGRLSWPIQGSLLADFGERRSTGLTWNGVLLAAERGMQVRAVYYGRVIYADWLPGMGLLTIVEHSGGYLSLYGHNEQLFKSVGDWVSPGDVIASAGDSGGSARPELYFEIRKGSRPQNPHQWIRKPLPKS
jgi:septal ring factor EnvC (AmiA/AmiB activator)